MVTLYYGGDSAQNYNTFFQGKDGSVAAIEETFKKALESKKNRLSKRILQKVGPKGIDAATRIVGFFVSAMGMSLVFHGVLEFLQSYGIVDDRVAGF